MANWADLPRELLGLILQNLHLPDHIRFSSVCVSWNLAMKEKSHRPKAQSPWLMLPGGDNTTAKFFSLSEKRTYNIPLPLPMIRRRMCIGSSHGWLITVDEMSEIHLLNPISRVQIQLPSVTTFPFVDAVRDSQGRITKFLVIDHLVKDRPPQKFKLKPEKMRCYFFFKAVLSSAPSSDGGGDFTVMLIHSPGNRLAFTRAGDKSWTEIPVPRGLVDVIHHDGKFYILSSWASFEVWDWVPDRLTFKPRIITWNVDTYINSKYLVLSVEGKMMMVLRDRENQKTTLCKVLLFDKKQRKWICKKSIGDNVLFIGNNHSMSVSARQFPELRPNCIYFTDVNAELVSWNRHESRDIGVFDMKDKSIKPLDSLGSHLNWPPPIWFTPTLF